MTPPHTRSHGGRRSALALQESSAASTGGVVDAASKTEATVAVPLHPIPQVSPLLCSYVLSSEQRKGTDGGGGGDDATVATANVAAAAGSLMPTAPALLASSPGWSRVLHSTVQYSSIYT